MKNNDEQRIPIDTSSSLMSELPGLSEEELLRQMIEEDEEEEGDEFSDLEEPGQVGYPLAPLLPSSSAPAVPYHPRDHDRAIREASLAPGKLWKEKAGLFSFLATNNIEVAFGKQDLPLALPEARRVIEQLGESTVIVSRILLLLWNIRHKQVQRRGNSVPILISEVLRLMGHTKHIKDRYTDGYRLDQKRKVIDDTLLLSSLLVRATIIENGQPTPLNILGHYLNSSLITKEIKGEQRVIGIYVAPGDWIKAYDVLPEHSTDQALARIDVAICKLDTQNDKYAIRIALYLAEQWRDQVLAHQEALLRGEAFTPQFQKPIKMADLLAGSMISIPKEHVRDRFIPRIERALRTLSNPPERKHDTDQADPQQRIIISVAKPLTEVNQQQPQWDRNWLETEWEILPPMDLLNSCTIIEPKTKRPRLPGKRKKQADD